MTPRLTTAALCLALLLGLRSAARAQPAAASAPPAAVAGSTDDVRSELETLGYRYDAPSRRYTGPDGTILSPQRLRAYLAPFDYRRHAISEEERTGILLDGYRLEPGTGHVLSPDTHKAISNLDYESHRVSDAADERRNALERLAALVDVQDAAKPLSPFARVQAQRLAENQKLPPAVAQDVGSLTALAGSVASDVDKAYLDETRAYDGKLDPAALKSRDLPLAAPAGTAPDHSYFDASERSLGAALQRATNDYLGRNPVGAEVLSHFKDANGVLTLPAMVILPIESQAEALYADGIVAISQSGFINTLVAEAPAAQRKRLRSQLNDSRALARYVNAHPEAIDRFMKDNDATIAHELTHAWQHRRDIFWSETDRENFPDADYVECEHEAFLVEMRYVHEKLKSDPGALARDVDELEGYQRFVADLDGWRDQITQEYLDAFPQAAADLPTGEELQKERVKAAQALENEGPVRQAIEKLKLVALGVGSAQEKIYQAGYGKLIDDFRKTQYPTIQKESNALLARTFLIKAKSAPSSSDLTYDLDEAVKYARASGDPALIQEARASVNKRVLEDFR